jgi:hypothetical protein
MRGARDLSLARSSSPVLSTTLLAASLTCACAPASPRERSRPDAAASAQQQLPPELAGLVAPWQPIDLSAAEQAPIWLVTRYEPGTYPCVEGPDGTRYMFLQDRFSVLRVVRGAVQAPGVDLNLDALRGPSFPRAYAEGRRYLLLIRPGPKGQALLADPAALGGLHDQLGADEVLGVIDLDQTEAEVRAERVAAARRDEAAGWDPTRWQALRAASAPDPAQQRHLAAFLQRTLAPRTPLAEVRAWLGPPDGQRLARNGSREDEYILARPAYAEAAEGAVYGDLRLRYDAALELHAVELGYLRWRVTPSGRASVKLSPDEHAALGLPRLELKFR